LLYFALFAFLRLYLVCVFSRTVLFVSISQVIGCEERLQNDPVDCVGRGEGRLNSAVTTTTTADVWYWLSSESVLW